MMTSSLNKEAGIQKLVDACDLITKTVRAKGGDVNIKAAVHQHHPSHAAHLYAIIHVIGSRIWLVHDMI